MNDRAKYLILVVSILMVAGVAAAGIAYLLFGVERMARPDIITNSSPSDEVWILSVDNARSATPGTSWSSMKITPVDRYSIPGNGTYVILVKTYQPETVVSVSLEYQVLLYVDKFGTEVYGRQDYVPFYTWSSCTCPNCGCTPGETDSIQLGTVNRFSDLNTTITIPGVGGHYGIIPSPDHLINPTLVLTTTKGDRGRITMDVWRAGAVV